MTETNTKFDQHLDAKGCYVALINGFPHGAFHGGVVKADVHAPDWRTEERLAYTCRLADILGALLSPEQDGGISTNPLSYATWAADAPAAMAHMTHNIVRCVAHLARVRRETGNLIHLDIEPEPDGVLETSTQFVRYFNEHLLCDGRDALCRELQINAARAEALIFDHVAVCLDTCHAAVMFEAMDACVRRYTAAGIRIGRVQLSSAIRVQFTGDKDRTQAQLKALSAYAESVYLHQVVGRQHNGTFSRFPDLQEALAAGPGAQTAEWRIHFHVPIFADSFDNLTSTQFNIRETLALQQRSPMTRHFEIETYTWDVLPPSLKLDLTDSILREYQWVLAANREMSLPNV